MKPTERGLYSRWRDSHPGPHRPCNLRPPGDKAAGYPAYLIAHRTKASQLLITATMHACNTNNQCALSPPHSPAVTPTNLVLSSCIMERTTSPDRLPQIVN